MREHSAAGPMKDTTTISIGYLDKEVLQVVTLDQSLTTQVHYVSFFYAMYPLKEGTGWKTLYPYKVKTLHVS